VVSEVGAVGVHGVCLDGHGAEDELRKQIFYIHIQSLSLSEAT